MLNRCVVFGGLHKGVIVLLCVSWAGCGPTIRFEARTAVDSTGSVVRTTRHIAADTRSRDELEGRYALPPGGTWTTETLPIKEGSTVHQQPMDVYQVERRWLAGCPTTSDHVRLARFADGAARNEFRVTVRDYVFVKSFAYEERFRDMVTTEGFDRAVRAFHGIFVEKVAKALGDGGDGPAPVRLSRTIRTALDPLLDKYLGIYRRESLRRFSEDEAVKEELEPLTDNESIAARVAAVVPPPEGEDADVWRKKIIDVVKDAKDHAMDERLEEETLGVYGFDLFAHYDFTIDVSLPGSVVESNGTSREGDVLKWAFGHSDFLGDDYVLRARSRIVYPWRIALAGTALVLLAGWWVIRRRTSER